MKRIITHHWGTLMCALLAFLTNDARAQTGVVWVEYRDCPVMLEHFVEVPAKETGQLEKVNVELNAAVTRGQVLANLEQEMAAMEVKIATLQHAAAKELAADDSQLKFKQLELKAAEEDLANHKAISKSVAPSELRNKELIVARVGVDVQSAEKALKRAALQADLTAASEQAARLRLSNRQIAAPIDGIVTSLLIRPGQWVEAGKPVMVISDLQHLLVDCLVPLEKIDVRRVVGLEVRAEGMQRAAGSAPVKLAGRIISYDPKVNSQGEVRIHARVDNVRQNDHWVLMPGMTVKLEVGIPAGSPPALMSRRPGTTTKK